MSDNKPNNDDRLIIILKQLGIAITSLGAFVTLIKGFQSNDGKLYFIISLLVTIGSLWVVCIYYLLLWKPKSETNENGLVLPVEKKMTSKAKKKHKIIRRAAFVGLLVIPISFGSGTPYLQNLLGGKPPSITTVPVSPNPKQEKICQPSGEFSSGRDVMAGMHKAEVIKALAGKGSSGSCIDYVRAFRTLNGQSMKEMLTTLDDLGNDRYLNQLNSNFYRAEGVNNSRLRMAIDAVLYKRNPNYPVSKDFLTSMDQMQKTNPDQHQEIVEFISIDLWKKAQPSQK